MCLETKETMRSQSGLVNSGATGEMLRAAGNRTVQQEWLVKPLHGKSSR